MRFDLSKLPRCGAKRRQGGEPCKRYGNRINGRCKLHGGRSTGAKTIEGKLKVSANSQKGLRNHLSPIHRESTTANADIALNILRILTSAPKIQWNHIYEVIETHRVVIEATKYTYSSDDLFLLQSCLDNYYIHIGSSHMKFTSFEFQINSLSDTVGRVKSELKRLKNDRKSELKRLRNDEQQTKDFWRS